VLSEAVNSAEEQGRNIEETVQAEAEPSNDSMSPPVLSSL